MFLVAVVIAFFICYAPLYLQRLLLAIMTLNGKLNVPSSFTSDLMAYLYILSGLTFYFGSAINPILYNVVSNKYRRAFRNLCCCRQSHRRKFFPPNQQRPPVRTRQLSNPKKFYCVKTHDKYLSPVINACPQLISTSNQEQLSLNVMKRPLSSKISHANSSSRISRQKTLPFNPYQ